ncbi:MAG TPA: rod shape-determining protein MreD [Tepidisphaeraceae bacterium]|jgi:rod shape-determining protein MreD
MRPLSYFILAYITLGLQAGIARAMQWNTAAPNFVLLAVIFIALNAPRDIALLACFGLGAMQDLTSGGTMGLYSFCYGIVALFILAIQQAVYRKHPVTHFMLALFAGILVAFILAIHGWLRPPGPLKAPDGQHLSAMHSPIMPLFYTAVYSAILAPFILGILQRISRAFRFQSARRRM